MLNTRTGLLPGFQSIFDWIATQGSPLMHWSEFLTYSWAAIVGPAKLTNPDAGGRGFRTQVWPHSMQVFLKGPPCLPHPRTFHQSFPKHPQSFCVLQSFWFLSFYSFSFTILLYFYFFCVCAWVFVNECAHACQGTREVVREKSSGIHSLLPPYRT